LEDDEDTKKWSMQTFEGAWIRGATAGGCRNFIETFAHNPQYVIELSDPDEDDEEEKCTVIIALMQKNRRAQRKLGMECLTIGFAIYALPEGTEYPSPLPMKFFKYNASVARSPTFINLREVSCRFKLPPGNYVIVPSCFEPNEEGEFIIRVFSEGETNLRENDGDVAMGDVDERVKETEDEEDENRKKVKGFFSGVAGDDSEIDWSELKQILDSALKKEVQFQFDGFSKDVCRSMVAMMDVDRSGKLGLDEFNELWKSVRTWKNVFQMYDKDVSGRLSAFELRQALTSAGYSVNNKVLESLVLRYGDSKGQILFDDFIMCAVKLKCMIEIFRERDTEDKNEATFSLEEWVDKTLYS
jgi:calpain